ncbi:hypothetical protein BJ170DRAFT_227949 [Xylariales sp. AK1849]|nr:hypothetical protein BJ170DRAFT_227949 [Xylariales sp. AK1849]
MTYFMRLSGANATPLGTKRFSSLAAEDIKQPRPKRPHLSLPPSFIYHDEEEPALPEHTTSTKGKSPSPDYRPDTSSPLSMINTSAVISVEEFNAIQQHKAMEELDLAHENLYNALHRLKRLSSDKLNKATYDLLFDEVQKSSFYYAPPAPPTIATSSASTQTDPIAPIKPASSNAATQAALSPTTVAVEPTIEECYRKDLASIKRPEPFVAAPRPYLVKTKLRDTPTPAPAPASQLRAPAPSTAGKPAPAVISLDSDDEDESPAQAPVKAPTKGKASKFIFCGGGGGANEIFWNGSVSDDVYDGAEASQYGSPAQQQSDPATFYGLRGDEAAAVADARLRFQDRELHAGQLPSAVAGHRLHLQDYLNAVGATHFKDPETAIARILQETSWGSRRTVDEETAIKESWCKGGKYTVMMGYPLIENVQFIVPTNSGMPDGDCYWRAIAFCMHGSDKDWALVKAEHLAYVHHVLSHAEHARCGLYTELNRKFFRTSSTADGGASFMANLWQVLHMAHAWTPSVMQQVTADLYNVCVIAFTKDERFNITETTMRGSFNSRHIFLQFTNGNHFQPMCTNEYLPSEFRYPRISVETTVKFANAPKATSKKTALEHPWRNDFTSSVPGPVPHVHGCDVEQLRRFLGSHPRT